MPGRHNVLNALGALAAARELGLSVEEISRSLEKFTGAKRRFETKGRVRGIWVVDDYAHHPTEIKVTLKAARQTQPKRLIVVSSPTVTRGHSSCLTNLPLLSRRLMNSL